MESDKPRPVTSVWLLRGLWIISALLAALVFFGVAVEYGELHSVNTVALSIGVVIAVLCVAGLVVGWGPTLPCMFFGMIIVYLIPGPYAHTAEEAVYKDLGAPIVGAVFGSFVGYLLDVSGILGDLPRLPRRFSLRAAFIIMTLVAVILGMITWLVRS